MNFPPVSTCCFAPVKVNECTKCRAPMSPLHYGKTTVVQTLLGKADFNMTKNERKFYSVGPELKMAEQPSSWEEEFEDAWSDAGTEYPNRKARVKTVIRTALESQKQGMIEAIEQVRNSDTFVFLDPHVSNRAFDNAVEIIRNFKS